MVLDMFSGEAKPTAHGDGRWTDRWTDGRMDGQMTDKYTRTFMCTRRGDPNELF